MTGENVYQMALALIDQADEADSEDYRLRAPAIIDVLQRELAFYEGVTVTQKVDSLDNVLEISDDTATRIMPYGLAASFALADKNGDMYSDYSAMYRILCRSIRGTETDTVDEYGMLDGMR
jgi:hypothetical protein